MRKTILLFDKTERSIDFLRPILKQRFVVTRITDGFIVNYCVNRIYDLEKEKLKLNDSE